MTDLLERAIAMHEAGELGSAATLYGQLLQSGERDPTAMHLLGVLCCQIGDNVQALQLIEQAAQLEPESAIIHSNLAEVHRSLGDFRASIASCQRALRLAPNLAEARNNLALALHADGQLTAAEAELRRLMQQDPESAAAHNNLGAVLRADGQLMAAETEFRLALQCDPSFASAQSNLGQLLLDFGRSSEAVAQLQEAAERNPCHAMSRHALGNALRAVGRDDHALKEYEAAWHLDPRLAESYAQAGLILLAEGKMGRALWRLERASRLDADNPVAWQRLAELYEIRDDFRRASAAWGRAVALSPPSAELRVAHGWSLHEQGRLNDAAEQYRAALEIDSRCAAAHLNLGGLHEELGEMPAAESEYRQALACDPRHLLSLGRLATLLRGRLPDVDFKAIQNCVANPALSDEPRSQLLFGLTHVHDAKGDYEAAAASSRSANALRQASLVRQHREYSRDEHRRLIDRVIDVFDPQLFRSLKGVGLTTARPVFVFGLPRSGTTLVEQILSSHSKVFGAGELPLAREDFARVIPITATSGDGTPLATRPDTESIRRTATEHLRRLDALDGGQSERIVDKMPDNYLFLGLLAIMFPKAVFIHCRRNPRDCALSCWMTDFRGMTWASDVENIASRFNDYRRLMRHWGHVLPTAIYHVDYERTIADFGSAARRLINACGLDWEPACLEFYRNNRPVRTASLTQVRRPIYSSSVGRWKNYERLLPELFRELPGV